jgi:hypothetical protein
MHQTPGEWRALGAAAGLRVLTDGVLTQGRQHWLVELTHPERRAGCISYSKSPSAR